MIKNISILAFCIGILVLIPAVTAFKPIPMYYFDPICYSELCENNTIIYDAETKQCIYSPTLSGNQRNRFLFLEKLNSTQSFNNQTPIIKNQSYKAVESCTFFNSSSSSELESMLALQETIRVTKIRRKVGLLFFLGIGTILFFVLRECIRGLSRL